MALRPFSFILWPTSVTGAGRGYNEAAPGWGGFIVFVVLSQAAHCVRRVVRERGNQKARAERAFRVEVLLLPLQLVPKLYAVLLL